MIPDRPTNWVLYQTSSQSTKHQTAYFSPIPSPGNEVVSVSIYVCTVYPVHARYSTVPYPSCGAQYSKNKKDEAKSK